MTDSGLDTQALLRLMAKPLAGGGSGREHASWHSDRAKNRGCGCTACAEGGKVSCQRRRGGGARGIHLVVKPVGEDAV